MSTATVAPVIRPKTIRPKAKTSRDPIKSVPTEPARSAAPLKGRIDRGLILGIAFALGAMIAGISATAIAHSYFLQPAGALIVLGGTIGVILITTPGPALVDSARRVKDLFCARQVDREKLVEEIVQYARVARHDGLLALEPLAQHASDSLLRDAVLLSLDVADRSELRATLETDLRLRERQGEMDAKVLEVAGGFAPTIGILGTVVGLIDVLRHFSNVASVGHGIGTAFVSTIYGLTLANLVLLPVANRIRARVADAFEVQELILEGVVALAEGSHPVAIRQRLNSFVRDTPQPASRRARGLKTIDALKLGASAKSSPDMTRRPKYLQAAEATTGRWMVSYSDIITILLVLFIALAARAYQDGMAFTPTRAATQAIPPVKEMPVRPLHSGASSEAPQSPAPAFSKNLADADKALRDRGILPNLENRGLVISLPQTILFPSGEDRIGPDALPMIARIAEVVGAIPNKISLVGHTDTIPIHSIRFKNNWELATARSVNLLEVLTGRYGISESRLSIESPGAFSPRSSNDTPNGRAENRRVEIIILPESTEAAIR